MSYSINSSAALYLLSTLTGSNTTPDLISIANGTSGGASNTDPVAALVHAEASQTKEVALQAKEPQTKSEINRFLAVVKKSTTIKDVLADPIARKVLLTANGLASQTDYVALATKALQSDPAVTGNFASKLPNAAWTSLVKTFNFAKNGLSVLKTQSVLDSVTKGYAQVQWGQAQDQTTPGLSAALDFRSRVGTVTKVDDILGDANFRKVVTVALGIPQQIAFQSLKTQEKAITDRLDLTKLKDPKFVEQFARRFLVANQADTSTVGTASITSLFA